MQLLLEGDHSVPTVHLMLRQRPLLQLGPSLNISHRKSKVLGDALPADKIG